jgi:hypothetical protein
MVAEKAVGSKQLEWKLRPKVLRALVKHLSLKKLQNKFERSKVAAG